MNSTKAGDKGPNSRLRLRNIDNSTAHAANKHHAALGLALHQVAGDRGSKQVGAVHIDREQLTHALNGVVSGLEVLAEAGAGDEVVNLAVLREDLGDAVVDAVGVGDIGEVSSDSGRPAWETWSALCWLFWRGGEVVAVAISDIAATIIIQRRVIVENELTSWRWGCLS